MHACMHACMQTCTHIAFTAAAASPGFDQPHRPGACKDTDARGDRRVDNRGFGARTDAKFAWSRAWRSRRDFISPRAPPHHLCAYLSISVLVYIYIIMYIYLYYVLYFASLPSPPPVPPPHPPTPHPLPPPRSPSPPPPLAGWGGGGRAAWGQPKLEAM